MSIKTDNRIQSKTLPILVNIGFLFFIPGLKKFYGKIKLYFLASFYCKNRLFRYRKITELSVLETVIFDIAQKHSVC